MEKTVTIPHDWGIIAVQLPLFPEHTHTVVVHAIRLVHSKLFNVEWRCIGDDILAGREFAETFDLALNEGKERFKDFLFAMPLEPENGRVDLNACLGRTIVVMAIPRKAGRATRMEIIHHLL